ncbi:MAG: hypothetical protein LBQ23_01815 [Puniceicoccales bacterium]|nr:hypothetical protein [Puniceicoccales bacterium]
MTRGSTITPKECSLNSETERLIATIRDTINGGGSVQIPAFAFERMQQMLKIISYARQESKL